MDNIRQQFLDDAVLKIENLLPALADESPDENLRREIFRIFHTIKGTAQTLNVTVPGKLAHELENLLHADSPPDAFNNPKIIALLREGTQILLDSLQKARNGEENSYPTGFVEKLREILPTVSESASEFFPDDIPADVFNKLSVDEKKALHASLAEGKSFYSLEVEFSLFDFDKQFRHLRESLQKQSKIIATFPKLDVSGADKIGFRIYFVSQASENKIAELVKSFDARLISHTAETNFGDGADGVLKQAVLAGKKVAARLGKKIDFETAHDDSELSPEYLKLLSECLLHLVRNAADHAIEQIGKIKIEVFSDAKNLLARVADDGRGLDVVKIKAKAIEKNLLAANENLADEELFDLIFAHGFSTAEKISEISGRGVGLDAVRDRVEKAGGTIRVESLPEKGTVFEIRLPEK